MLSDFIKTLKVGRFLFKIDANVLRDVVNGFHVTFIVYATNFTRNLSVFVTGTFSPLSDNPVFLACVGDSGLGLVWGSTSDFRDAPCVVVCVGSPESDSG